MIRLDADEVNSRRKGGPELDNSKTE